MNPLEEFRPGIYRHYKKPLYQGLFLAHDANADTLIDYGDGPVGARIVVVYLPLQLDRAHEGVRPAVRTFEDWTAWVQPAYPEEPAIHPERSQQALAWADGWRPRFDYLGPVFTKDML